MKNTILFLITIVLLGFNACKPEDEPLILSGISFQEKDISIEEGKEHDIKFKLEPVGVVADIVWTSTNEKVATVENGVIKALSRGSSNIRATAGEFTSTMTVNVTRTDKDYVLVWSDEFDGTELNSNNWTIETGGNGWGNQEKQNYTNRSENLRLENGHLIIEARKEKFGNNDYTSARIMSKNKVSYKYGKFEARISLPAGAGTWPAYWMMGQNIDIARWPLCGEIDIMEHVGSQPRMISHATHTSEKNGSRGNNWHWQRNFDFEVENNFVTYAIEWEERANEGYDNISFYVNGVKSTTIWEPVNATVQQWPFKQEFFIILNLALGGTMGGAIDDKIFDNPVIMKVDYVRVYQRK